jgi:hypothetical protein
MMVIKVFDYDRSETLWEILLDDVIIYFLIIIR